MKEKLDKLISKKIAAGPQVCFLCGLTTHVDPGHYMKRRHLATRWDMDNIRPLCRPCNLKDDMVEYREKLVQDIGEYRVGEVERKARLNVKFLKQDYLEMIKDFS